VRTGAFDDFKRWLVAQATADVRVQAILLAWALGAPIIALPAVTKVPLDQLSASVGRIVAILALLPPWILILLVTGRRGLRGAWPLAVVGSLAFIAGQLPASQWLGPYLPDIIGAVVCFGALLLLLRFWRPRETLGFGGVAVAEEKINSSRTNGGEPPPHPAGSSAGPTASPASTREAIRGLVPLGILIVVVVAATGPWSHLTNYNFTKPTVTATSSLSGKPADVSWSFSPAVAGTWILASWLVILVALRVRPRGVPGIFRLTFSQMWGALIVAPRRSSSWPRSSASHERAVRRLPVLGGRPVAHALAAAAFAEFGGRRNRQADRAADHQRGRLDQ
jgi:lactate permease